MLILLMLLLVILWWRIFNAERELVLSSRGNCLGDFQRLQLFSILLSNLVVTSSFPFPGSLFQEVTKPVLISDRVTSTCFSSFVRHLKYTRFSLQVLKYYCMISAEPCQRFWSQMRKPRCQFRACANRYEISPNPVLRSARAVYHTISEFSN